METYGVELTKKFSFSAAHISSIKGNLIERVLGHSYTGSLKVISRKINPLSSYVIDFGDISNILERQCEIFNGRTLIPRYDCINKIQEKEEYVDLICEDGAYFSFPLKDVIILDCQQITLQFLAKYFVEIFFKEMEKINPTWRDTIEAIKLRCKISEDQGETWSYTLNIN
jgi:6-pyruvoyl-tetrahydropterin synthase